MSLASSLKPEEARRVWLRMDLAAGTIRLADGAVGATGVWDYVAFNGFTKVNYRGTDAHDEVYMAAAAHSAP